MTKLSLVLAPLLITLSLQTVYAQDAGTFADEPAAELSPKEQRAADKAAQRAERAAQKAARQAEKAAAKEAKQAEREANKAAKAAARAAKQASRAAESEAKQAARAARKAERQTTRKAEREAKQAAKQAARDARKAEKQAARDAKKAQRAAARDQRRADRKARRAERKAAEAVLMATKAGKGKGKNPRQEPGDPSAALTALERHTEALLADPRVIGTGVSWQKDGTPVIKVFTNQGKDKKAQDKGDKLPKSLDGIKVVTANVGRFYALNLDCNVRAGKEGCDGFAAAEAQNGTGETEAVSADDWQQRPVPIGVSIGNSFSSAGTLGCRVSSGCHKYALSASHVIAEPGAPVAEAGAPVFQPSLPDGGLAPDDQIAAMYAAVPIVLGTGSDVQNRVDAALIQIEDDQVGTTTRENGYGEPRVDTVAPSLDLGVMKYGRSSAMTSGYIDTIAATVIISYEGGDARFVDQVLIQSDTKGVDFSLPGDSGALVVAANGDDDRKPVGLLFASGRGYTVANPITEVLTALDVDIDGEF